jgi:hypothetical protein
VELRHIVLQDIESKGYVSFRNFIPDYTVRNVDINAKKSLLYLFSNDYNAFQRFGSSLPFVWEIKTHNNIITIFKMLYNLTKDQELLSSIEPFQYIPSKKFRDTNLKYYWKFVDFPLDHGNKPKFLIGIYNVCGDVEFSFVENSMHAFEQLKHLLIGTRPYKVTVRNNSDCTKSCFKIDEQCLSDAIAKINTENGSPMLKILKLNLIKGDLVIMDPRMLIKVSPSWKYDCEPMMIIPLSYHIKENIPERTIKRLLHTFFTGGRTQCNLARMSNTGVNFRKSTEFTRENNYRNIDEFSCMFTNTHDFLHQLIKCPMSIFVNDISRDIILPSLFYGREGLAFKLLGANYRDFKALGEILDATMILCQKREFLEPNAHFKNSCKNLEICQNTLYSKSYNFQTDIHPAEYLLLAIIKTWIDKTTRI